ncbi:MAG: hypothetical protein IJK75_03140 [Bacteroidales bacterium]|nr:hypothetical protein [Bacteroidales bacterium]
MRRFLVFVTILVPLFFQVAAFGQDSKMDLALDHYETIIDRCILMRDRAQRGEKIEADELKSLLEQVSSLRTTLQNSSKGMTARQRERYERIRRRYTVAFQPGKVVSRSVVRLPKVDWVPRVEEILRFAQDDRLDASCLPERAQRPKDLRSAQYEAPWRIGVMAIGGWRPSTWTYGAMATVTHNRLGFYIKGRSNFTKDIHESICSSDGTSEGTIIWTTGREKHPAWNLGAGVIFKIAGPLGIYAGSGYGNRTTLWEEASGSWAKVEEYSFKGACADAGIVLGIRNFTASLGISSITFRNPSLEIGVGLRF